MSVLAAEEDEETELVVVEDIESSKKSSKKGTTEKMKKVRVEWMSDGVKQGDRTMYSCVEVNHSLVSDPVTCAGHLLVCELIEHSVMLCCRFRKETMCQ